jgi:hypothetical protein
MAINGSATTRRGASVEAELVRPVGSGGDVYWVRFDGDLDEQKQPVTRIRRVEKFLT